MSDEWREGYIKPPEGGGMPEKFRLMIERFTRPCEVCGYNGPMQYKATASGEMACAECGNIFDKPLMDEPDGEKR